MAEEPENRTWAESEGEPSPEPPYGHRRSDVDALGLDKRRPVIGGRYSPSVARQVTVYGIFLAVVAAVALGVLFAVNELDQPPERYEQQAPWTGSQLEPAPIDFPRNGSSD